MICIGPLVFHLPGRASSPARRGGSEHRNVEGGRRGQESSAHDVAGEEEGEGPTTRAALSQVRRTRLEGGGGGGGGQIAENELQRRSGGYISRGEAKPASQQGLDVLPSLPARSFPLRRRSFSPSHRRSFLRHYGAAPFALLVGEALFRETRRLLSFSFIASFITLLRRCVFAASPLLFFFTPRSIYLQLHSAVTTRPTTWNEMKFLRRKVPPGISSSLCPSSLFLSLFLATFLSALPSSSSETETCSQIFESFGGETFPIL